MRARRIGVWVSLYCSFAWAFAPLANAQAPRGEVTLPGDQDGGYWLRPTGNPGVARRIVDFEYQLTRARAAYAGRERVGEPWMEPLRFANFRLHTNFKKPDNFSFDGARVLNGRAGTGSALDGVLAHNMGTLRFWASNPMFVPGAYQAALGRAVAAERDRNLNEFDRAISFWRATGDRIRAAHQTYAEKDVIPAARKLISETFEPAQDFVRTQFAPAVAKQPVAPETKEGAAQLKPPPQAAASSFVFLLGEKLRENRGRPRSMLPVLQDLYELQDLDLSVLADRDRDALETIAEQHFENGLVNAKVVGKELALSAETLGTILQTSPASREGRAIRHLINKGLILYGSENVGELKQEVLGAVALSLGADIAAAADDKKIERELIQRINAVYDKILGFVPLASTAKELAQILNGMATGMDLQGQPMKLGDYALRGATALFGIPAFAKATLTIGGKLIRYPFVLGANALEKLGLRKALAEAAKEGESYLVPIVTEQIGKKLEKGLPFYAAEFKKEIDLTQDFLRKAFEKHGSQVTDKIIKRAADEKELVSQWLDDQRAAQLIMDVYSDFKAGKLILDKNGRIDVAIPKGLARIVNEHGVWVESTIARIVPFADGREGIISAYGILPK